MSVLARTHARWPPGAGGRARAGPRTFHHDCFADGFALFETVADALRDGRSARTVKAALGA